jgi:Tol biopolymer transport system component
MVVCVTPGDDYLPGLFYSHHACRRHSSPRKALGDATSAASSEMATAGGDLTDPGSAIGTLSYMSPEQARGEELDPRSDLFSLGAVFYEMVTGTVAFGGNTTAVIHDAILNRTPVSPLQLQPEIPHGVAELVERLLEKDLQVRYQSAADLEAALKRLKRGSDRSGSRPVSTPQLSSRKGSKLAIAVVGGLILILAAAAAITFRAPDTSQNSVKLTPITNSGRVDGVALSSDGKYLAYVEQRAGQFSLHVRQMATGSAVQVMAPTPERLHDVTFSRDGNYLYLVKNADLVGTLYQLPVLGGVPKKLVADVDGPITFSPDGNEFAFIRRIPADNTSSVMLANADGSNVKTLAKSSEALAARAGWSPDGAKIAVPAFRDGQIFLFAVGDGEPEKIVIPGWQYIESFAWLPTGKGWILAAEELGGDRFARHQVLEVSYPELQIRRITTDLSDYHSLTGTSDFSTLAAVDLTNQTSIWIAPPESPDQARRVLGGRTDGMRGVAWTKDGRIAYADDAGVGWVMNSDGSNVRPFGGIRHAAFQLTLCGPGPMMAFLGAVPGSGRGQVELGDPDGPAARVITTEANSFQPSCTPDGKWVIYSKDDRELWKSPADDGSASKLLDNVRNAEISPDGQWIAFVSSTPGRPSRLLLKSITGNDAPRDLDAQRPFHWNGDSTGLIIVKIENEVANLWELPLDGPAKQITHFTSDLISSFARHPDGRLAIARGFQSRDGVLIERAKIAAR